MLFLAKTAHEKRARPAAAAVTAVAVAVSLTCACGTYGRILWDDGADAAALTEEGGRLGPGDSTAEDAGILGTDATIGAIAILDGESPTGSHGGGGGDAFVETCPADQVVVGFSGQLYFDPDAGQSTPWIGILQTRCGAVALGGPGREQVVVGPGASLPQLGFFAGPGPMPFSSPCPADQIVVGFSGRSGAFVDGLAVVCAHWIVQATGAAYALSEDSVTTLTYAGGAGGDAFGLESCPSGQMATGIAGRSGFWLDHFGLLCSEAALVPGADR
jgi:hypothetical protein